MCLGTVKGLSGEILSVCLVCDGKKLSASGHFSIQNTSGSQEEYSAKGTLNYWLHGCFRDSPHPRRVGWAIRLCYPTAVGLYPDLAISFIHSHRKYLLSILYMPNFLPGAFKQQGVRDDPWAQNSYIWLGKWTMSNHRCWGHVAMRTDRKGAHTPPSFSLLICKMGIVSPL